jgi:hypothetical protein
LAGAIVAVAIIAWVLMYSQLRLSNATVYVKGDRIGVTNALRIRRELQIADVGYLQLCSLAMNDAARPLGMFLVITQKGRCRLRFYGADALRRGGIDEVSALSGLELRGSWDQKVSLAQLRSEFPGAISRTLAISGLSAQDPTMFFWVVTAVVYVIGLVGVFIYLALQP